MEIPKIEFVYSDIYDNMFREDVNVKRFLKAKNISYPSEEKIKSYMGDVGKLWEKDGRKILEEISKITNLKWKDKKIKCYVVGVARPFSNPLTLRLFENKKDFIDTLTHELIHQMQIQNQKIWRNGFRKFILKEYSNESKLTKAHIFLHAVHKILILKLFNQKRLKRQVNSHSKFRDYERAWEIVEKEGAENILRKFKKKMDKQ